MVVRKKDEFQAQIDRLAHRLDGAVRGRLRRLESRLNGLLARPGYAGLPGRLAWRARHLSDLSASLSAEARDGLEHRRRRVEMLRRGLSQCDPRHRLGRVRTTLVAERGRLDAAMSRRLHGMQSRFKAAAAALSGLSPLAVLARGYAVCWDSNRDKVLRDAATVRAGDAIRVTLERGEIRARVTEP